MSSILKSRIDSDLKWKAKAVLAEIGLKPRAALELFYQQIIKRRAIPFPVQADCPEDEVLSPAGRENQPGDSTPKQPSPHRARLRRAAKKRVPTDPRWEERPSEE